MALASAGVNSRSSLVGKWYVDKSFLLKEYLAWVPPELHMPVQTFWPPVEFIEDEFERIPGSLTSIPAVRDKAGLVEKMKALISSETRQFLTLRDVDSECDSDE